MFEKIYSYLNNYKKDYLRINKATSKKENKVERPKTARINIKNIIIKNDKSIIENDNNRTKNNRQVEIYKTETETNLRSNISYINNDDKSFGKKSQKILIIFLL